MWYQVLSDAYDVASIIVWFMVMMILVTLVNKGHPEGENLNLTGCRTVRDEEGASLT